MVRIKNRYLLVNILYPKSPQQHNKINRPTAVPDSIQFRWPTPDALTPQLLVKAIRDQILFMYGDYGYGISFTGLHVKYLSPATSTAIVRCSRANYELVWAALTFMTHLPQLPEQSILQPCVMQVVRVSGTVRKAEEEAIKRAKAAILKAKRENSSGDLGGLSAILGSSPGKGDSTNFEGANKMIMAIEDEDDDGDEDQDLMDEG
ncbi:MAG: hypothetical protein Q9170_002336 [Blastenia crenularia]